MNKWNFIGWALLSGLLALVSCDDRSESEPKHEIRLTSAILSTARGTDLNLQSTKIVAGQPVGVTITKASTAHHNVLWLADAHGMLVNVGTPVYWGNSAITVTAYHPYHADWTGTNHTFAVETDQTTDEGYLNSDLLWAQATASASDAPVDLNFTHRLAKVNVTLTSDDLTDLSHIGISICGTHLSAGFNPTTGLLGSASGNVADIKASVTTETAHTASAVIIPQTVGQGTKFVKITYDGRDYFHTMPDTVEFKSGRSYHFQLKLSVKNNNGIGFVYEDAEMTEGDTYDFTFEWSNE